MSYNAYDRKYDPSICSQIPEMFADRSSITQVAALKLGVSRATYYRWKEEHPEFKAVCDFSENIAEANMEKVGDQGMRGEIEDFNATTYIFTMKNRFRQTYGEDKTLDKSPTDTLLEQLVLGNAQIVRNDKK